MKFRVSNVEAFRKYEADEDGDLGVLIADIRGESAPSPAMTAGTAFHKALELAPTGVAYDALHQDGHVFVFPGEFEIDVTPIRELRASKTYTVDGEPIVISGQVDGLDGNEIIDHKTTARFDPERYMAGYQWRLYLAIFGAQRFRWNVFEMQLVESTREAEGFTLPPAEYEVTAQHTLIQYRYPGLEDDCAALVGRFARFVREHVEART